MQPIVQLSLDLTSIEEALHVAEIGVRAGVDWLEAGTPLILAEGLRAVQALHARFLTGDFAALDAPTAADLMHVSQRTVGVLQQVYQPHAFNLGLNLGRTAGAGLPDHLHVHVVPRWEGDTNFMPIVGETKVLPESLEQTYARLAPHFSTP